VRHIEPIQQYDPTASTVDGDTEGEEEEHSQNVAESKDNSDRVPQVDGQLNPHWQYKQQQIREWTQHKVADETERWRERLNTLPS
jgi:hypothetical protein